MTEPFRGPLADGPAEHHLLVDTPPLARFGAAEVRRVISATWVLVVAVSFAVAAWLPRRMIGRRVALTAVASEALVGGFIRLGPTYVKLGQLIASSPGLFP